MPDKPRKPVTSTTFQELVNESFEIKESCELKNLQPAPDQQEIPAILQKMAERVDDFVHNLTDLIAHEDITQERLSADGETNAKERSPMGAV